MEKQVWAVTEWSPGPVPPGGRALTDALHELASTDWLANSELSKKKFATPPQEARLAVWWYVAWKLRSTRP